MGTEPKKILYFFKFSGKVQVRLKNSGYPIHWFLLRR